MTTTNRRIAAIATGQLGLLSRRQAEDAGITGNQLRSRVTSGSLLQVGANTFRLPGADATAVCELRALMMDIGDDVWASGPTAAALQGFDGFVLKPPFDVTILRGRDVQRVGHRIHTTARLDLIDRAVVGDIRVLSGARTLIDLARTQTTERLTIAYDSGLRDGRFNESLVHRRIVALRSSGRFGIPKLLEAIEGAEAIRGGHSWLEREYLRLVAEAGLPRPEVQQVLTRANDRLVRVDFRFPGTRVVVEVLGYRYHRTADQMRRDASRLNALVAEGFLPYQFVYEAIVDSPSDVIATTLPHSPVCRRSFVSAHFGGASIFADTNLEGGSYCPPDGRPR
jgi:very-short-patch-repair endonuclease